MAAATDPVNAITIRPTAEQPVSVPPPGVVLDDAQVPPPPPGYITDPMTGFSADMETAPPETGPRPRGLPTAILQAPYEIAKGLATLPKRVLENSQESLDTGNYDPSSPL